jgi:hypothetical protein
MVLTSAVEAFESAKPTQSLNDAMSAPHDKCLLAMNAMFARADVASHDPTNGMAPALDVEDGITIARYSLPETIVTKIHQQPV